MATSLTVDSSDIDDYGAENGAATGPESIELRLLVTDPEVCQELTHHPEGDAREDFALTALRIGIMAIRQAQGRIDADVVKHEGDRLVTELRHMLDTHQSSVNENVAGCLQAYFDPESGKFSERVHRLVKDGGEIEQMLKRQVGDSDSELVKTLAMHIGEHSPLMKLLHPDASDGLISSISMATEATLNQQRERILSEFSLDNKEGALARLITELNETHIKSGEVLEQRIDAMVSEFSLDKKDSALSRLVGRVETAQRTISAEFSLDTEGSALARLRRELVGLVEKDQSAREEFYRKVTESLAEINARRDEAKRGTQHGLAFEDALFQHVDRLSQKSGDIATNTGSTVGRIKNSKVGDIVVEIGPEHVASGSRVVIEAKQKQRYPLKEALAEIETARKNRDAQTGLFVYSRGMASETMEPFARYGNDFVLIWDAEDPSTDVVLQAALSVARALCTRSVTEAQKLEVDFESLDRAMLDIEKQLNGFDEINTSANSVVSAANKILDRARIMQNKLSSNVDMLNGAIDDIRRVLADSDSGK
ncbi:MAG: hypothetical protein RIB46_12180 [Pseudomonadales bacterium]